MLLSVTVGGRAVRLSLPVALQAAELAYPMQHWLWRRRVLVHCATCHAACSSAAPPATRSRRPSSSPLARCRSYHGVRDGDGHQLVSCRFHSRACSVARVAVSVGLRDLLLRAEPRSCVQKRAESAGKWKRGRAASGDWCALQVHSAPASPPTFHCSHRHSCVQGGDLLQGAARHPHGAALVPRQHGRPGASDQDQEQVRCVDLQCQPPHTHAPLSRDISRTPLESAAHKHDADWASGPRAENTPERWRGLRWLAGTREGGECGRKEEEAWRRRGGRMEDASAFDGHRDLMLNVLYTGSPSHHPIRAGSAFSSCALSC
eukprot:3146265-Rhodomonas_salina.2